MSITVIPAIDPRAEHTEPAEAYVATVRVLVETPDSLDARNKEAYVYDSLSELLRGKVVDWGYEELPRPVAIQNPHHEGDLP